MKDLREAPITTGLPRATSSSNRSMSSILCTDVDDRGALCRQLQPVGDRLVGLDVATTVGERIGGHVYDSHDPELRGCRHGPSSGQCPWRSKYWRACSSRSRSRLLSTLIRNI